MNDKTDNESIQADNDIKPAPEKPRTHPTVEEQLKIAEFLSNNGYTGESGILGFLEWVRDACHNNSVGKGFWEHDLDFVGDDHGHFYFHPRGTNKHVPPNSHTSIDVEKIMLMVTELSEATEVIREGNIQQLSVKVPHHSHVGEELADCIVRILDFCGRHDIPVLEIMLLKMAYNATRAHKHGKNF